MALHISENQGYFEISGSITSQNLGMLKVYFNSLLEKYNTIWISTKNIEGIDDAALLYFERMCREVSKENKTINILGKQKQVVSKVISIPETDYILSTNRD